MSASHPTHVTESEKHILQNGLDRLLKETSELDWKALPSERYPHPLRSVFYRDLPAMAAVRSEVEARMADDPVAVLGKALVLLELHDAHQPDAAEYFPEDMPFIRACFASKRCNGWIIFRYFIFEKKGSLRRRLGGYSDTKCLEKMQYRAIMGPPLSSMR